jgi:hypothetical protein
MVIMLRLGFDRNVDSDGKFLPNSKTPTEIAWHNLTEISPIHHIELVISASTAWFRANPDKTVQDLEKQFRDNKLPVYLIAKQGESPIIDGQPTTLTGINGKPSQGDLELPYSLVYSCRPEKLALSELLENSTSYEENYEKLARTGVYQVNQPNTGDTSLTKPDPSLEKDVQTKALQNNDVITMVSYNMVSLRLRKLSAQQVNDEMNHDISEATRLTGKPSEAKTIGRADDGSHILAHFIDGKVISEYGLMICSDQRTKIILANDKSTWV